MAPLVDMVSGWVPYMKVRGWRAVCRNLLDRDLWGGKEGRAEQWRSWPQWGFSWGLSHPPFRVVPNWDKGPDLTFIWYRLPPIRGITLREAGPCSQQGFPAREVAVSQLYSPHPQQLGDESAGPEGLWLEHNSIQHNAVWYKTESSVEIISDT